MATEKVTISVFASVFGFQVNLPLDDDDACAEGRLQCPIKPGKHETLKYRLKIKDDYYPVSDSLWMTWDEMIFFLMIRFREMWDLNYQHLREQL